MKKENHPIIAKEGWAAILIVSVTTLVSIFLSIELTFFLIIILFFVIQFFRDPRKIIQIKKPCIVSPADGRVIFVGNAKDNFTNREALKISVFMNVFNVHSNRIPISGKITKIQHFKGKFFNASLDKSSDLNEKNSIAIENSDGIVITCVQIAGLIARRILCYVKKNDKVNMGERYGFIKFGSRVDLFVPKGITPLVSVGQRVKSGETIIAYL